MSIRFTLSGGDFKFDAEGAKAELNQYLNDFVKRGGIKWLGATVLAIIPTWSKASRATFQKLARELGTSIPYGPQLSRKDREPLGLSTGSGSGFFPSTTGQPYFIYSSTLRYLEYNEYNRAVAGLPPKPFSNFVTRTPYRFQDKGAAAWAAHLTTFKLPDLTKYLG